MRVTLNNISKQYNNSDKKTVNGISNISLTFEENGLYFICGKSGAGKTTVLNLIGGIISPTSGTIYFNNKSSNIDNQRNIWRVVEKII